MACLSHALSNEKEEIMGLLLGSFDGTTVRIWDAIPLQRISAARAKDRVEVSPNQLIAATKTAEQMTRESGVATSVVGWIHSHPHITVLPSHIDCRTQGSYQSIGESFVGLIFSVFSSDPATHTGELNLLAFQSIKDSTAQGGWRQRRIPIEIVDCQSPAHFFSGKRAVGTSTGCDNADTIGAADDADLADNDDEMRLRRPCPPMSASLEHLMEQVECRMVEERKAYESSLATPTSGHQHLPFAQAARSSIYQSVLCTLARQSCLPIQYIVKARAARLKSEKRRLKALISHREAQLREVHEPVGNTTET